MVEFREAGSNLLYEFFIDDVNYVRMADGDTIWFRKYVDDELNASFNYDNRYIPPPRIKRMTLYFSYSFSGLHDPNLFDATSEEDVNAGISLGFEFDFLNTANHSIKAGAGLLYQFPRKPVNSNGNFNFVPLYVYFKLGLPKREFIQPYFIPAFGYNFFNGDDKYSKDINMSGGFYNSIGFGMIIKYNLDIKLLYQFNRGTINFKSSGEEKEVIYSNLSLFFGYYF
jgi:hypothetical protein